jgi:hypothetical protein
MHRFHRHEGTRDKESYIAAVDKVRPHVSAEGHPEFKAQILADLRHIVQLPAVGRIIEVAVVSLDLDQSDIATGPDKFDIRCVNLRPLCVHKFDPDGFGRDARDIELDFGSHDIF